MQISNEVNQPGVAAACHIASPLHDGVGGPNLCGSPPDPAAQYRGLDQAYRAHAEGWAGAPTCRDCLAVALIAMGAGRLRPHASAVAPSLRLPEGAAGEELLAQLRRLAADQPGRLELVPYVQVSASALYALRAVLLFHGDGYWSAERRAEWVRLTGRPEAITRALCDTVRAALAAAGEAPV